MSGLGKILKTAGIATPIAIAAMALPAAILATTGGRQSAIVVFMRPVDPDSLPRDITILSWSDRVAKLDGIDAVTARRLYARGAALVMPYRKSGCMSYRKV